MLRKIISSPLTLILVTNIIVFFFPDNKVAVIALIWFATWHIIIPIDFIIQKKKEISGKEVDVGSGFIITFTILKIILFMAIIPYSYLRHLLPTELPMQFTTLSIIAGLIIWAAFSYIDKYPYIKNKPQGILVLALAEIYFLFITWIIIAIAIEVIQKIQKAM